MQGRARLPHTATFVVTRAAYSRASGRLPAALLALALALGIVRPGPARAAAAPLTLSLEEDPSSLDTILNTGYGWLLGPLSQGYLFLVDDRGRLVPDRALSVPTRAGGGISADGRTIRYRIRTGRWSDGAPVRRPRRRLHRFRVAQPADQRARSLHRRADSNRSRCRGPTRSSCTSRRPRRRSSRRS
jgi:hypothetical protein